jgi:hypothetical protein
VGHNPRSRVQSYTSTGMHPSPHAVTSGALALEDVFALAASMLVRQRRDGRGISCLQVSPERRRALLLPGTPVS